MGRGIDLLTNTRRQGQLNIYRDQDSHLFSMIMRKTHALINKVTRNCRKHLHEVINILDLSCSLTTAKQTLHDAEIYSHVAIKKPFVSKKHASARIISWCEKYKEKTAYDWSQVIFSDESSVGIGKQSRQTGEKV
jgi:hypothetical protein